MAYATYQDYVNYTASTDSPDQERVTRLLDHAADYLDYAVRANYDATDATHVEAMRKASCAIVEAWLTNGEETAATGRVVKETVGKVSVEYDSSGYGGGLPPAAARYLMRAGLGFSGVRMVF